MSGHRCMVVVGAQWGDEGKGKIVDVLAEDVDVVARYQGGANAGHTVHVAGEEFILHQIPSGVLHPAKRCLMGNGVVLDVAQFFEEADALEARGVDAEARVGVSGRAHLLLEYHKRLDAASEQRRGARRIGTTGKGIGPAYEDKVARHGVRVADLRDPERAGRLIRAAAERANSRLESAGGDPVDLDEIVERTLRTGERMLPLITDVGQEIHTTLGSGKRVLLEGAQGSMLDIDHGTYPYVTSSSTTAAGAALGVGIGPMAIDAALGVVKAYTTRVGSGPLPTELHGEPGERLRELGGEYGATTGRPRRCGWFDAEVVRFAARVNGLTGLALTKLDVLDSMAEVRIATGYSVGGDPLGYFPDSLELLESVEPIYETLPGWETDTTGVRAETDLPPEARAFLQRVEELVEVPIRYVSVGTGRSQIIRIGN